MSSLEQHIKENRTMHDLSLSQTSKVIRFDLITYYLIATVVERAALLIRLLVCELRDSSKLTHAQIPILATFYSMTIFF